MKEAVRFLSVQEPELKSAVQYGAEDLRLIFSYCRQTTVCEIHYLPPTLLVLAGNLGVGIAMISTQFPTG